jgi:HPt (histidine-containing phosphotransfer) domain-containing protein
MCQHFQSFVPGRLAEVNEALCERNPLRLWETAHKLGGMISSFSATAAGAAALLGRQGNDGEFEDATQTYSKLTAIVDKLFTSFDSLTVEQLRRR